MILRKKHIRQLARDLLAKHKVSAPPVDVEAIAKRLGLRISKHHVDSDVDGFLLRTGREGKTVIGVNNAHHIHRQRFTIAHELAHFLLHKGDAVHVDQSAQIEVKLRNANSSTGTDIEEMEANAFAAEILMPEPLLERDILALKKTSLKDDKFVSQLADRYCVSPQALTLRLVNLGYIRL
jgi:Zn-dependent peptidase ImmA (M78 family)